MAVGLLPFAGTAAKITYGAYQENQARKRLNQMGDRPEFDVTDEQKRSLQRAERLAKFGFSPEETSQFENNLAKNRNVSFNRGLSIGGGGVSQAINAVNNVNQTNAIVDFAANDARLNRSNIRYADSRGDVVSNQKNRNTAQKLAYRDEVERNLGRARSNGLTNVVEGLSEVPYVSMLNKYWRNKMLGGQEAEEITPAFSKKEFSTETLPIKNSNFSLPAEYSNPSINRLPRATREDILYVSPIRGYNQRLT